MSGALRYDYAVDPEPNSTANRLVRLVGRDKHVLDLGCAAGGLDRVLLANGCTVTGVEIDAEAAKLAETVCERVVVGDLDLLDLDTTFDRATFDVVLAGDVLEHLKEPGRLLRELPRLLAPGGYLVLSVPNTAHGDVRLALLHGTLPRSATGLLDTTHLQFLTRRGLLDLIAGNGWSTVHLESVPLGIGDSEVPFLHDALTGKVLADLWADPEALAYQYVAVAVPGSGEELGLLASLLHDTVEGPLASPPAPAPAAEVRDLTEQLCVLRLNHTDLGLRYRGEVQRLQALIWSLESRLETQSTASGHKRRKLRRRARQQVAAAASARQAEIDVLTRERDEARGERDAARGELAVIHDSRLWAGASAYRAGLARARHLVQQVSR